MKSMHVMIHSFLNSLLILIETSLHCLSVHHQIKCYDEHDQENGRETVTPDVHTLVVQHEQAFEYFFGGVEPNPIPMGDVFIVLHEMGSWFVVSYKVGISFLLSLTFRTFVVFRCFFLDYFFCWLFLGLTWHICVDKWFLIISEF